VFSSDYELQHALELTGSPLRITVFLNQPAQPQPPVTPQETIVVPITPVSDDVEEQLPPWRRGGLGRGGRGPTLTKEERIALKKTRISTRLSLLEAQLVDPSLASERERAITWRISKLREKLEGLLEERADGEIYGCGSERPWRPHTHVHPPGFEHVHPHEHYHHHEVEASGHPHGPCRSRGRGCRGGRGRWARDAVAQQQQEETQNIQDGAQPLGKKWVVPKETWIQFQEAKENLKVARSSGDAEAIKNALEALVIAKQFKKEHRYPKA